ncbi:MAG: GntR family transcriptional regulator [Candidatus Methylomirabilales bacterium]
MAEDRSLVTRGIGAQLHDIILGRILDGTYRPGERLLPAELRAAFGVSITPIRDALQELRRAGFVHVRPREAVTVSQLDAKRARDVLDMRIALEMLAARNAAGCAPAAEVQALDRRLREAEAALAQSGDEAALEAVDWALHDLVLRHADNELLQEALRTIHRHVHWVGVISGPVIRRYRQSFEEHKQVLRALLRRDADGAAEAMRRHLTKTKRAVLRYLERRAPAAAPPARRPRAAAQGGRG